MGHLPRQVRLDRERTRLEEIAKKRGFDSAAIMLHEMYIVQRIPIERIAHELFTPLFTLRKYFTELGITVRTRGGRNNVRIEITQELVDEVSRDGISAVCARLGVDYITLMQRLQAWSKEHK